MELLTLGAGIYLLLIEEVVEKEKEIAYYQMGLLEKMQRIMSGIWIRILCNIANTTISIGEVQRTW